jgi:hypothetical protein
MSHVEDLIYKLKEFKSNRDLEEVVDAIMFCDVKILKTFNAVIFSLLGPLTFTSADKKLKRKVKLLLKIVSNDDDLTSVFIEGIDKNCQKEIVEEMFCSFRGFVKLRYKQKKRHCYVRMDSVEHAHELVAHLESPGIRMSKKSRLLSGSISLRKVRGNDDKMSTVPPVEVDEQQIVSSIGSKRQRPAATESNNIAQQENGTWMKLALNDFLKYSTVLDV